MGFGFKLIMNNLYKNIPIGRDAAKDGAYVIVSSCSKGEGDGLIP